MEDFDEWMNLLIEAKNLGITIEEIKEFFDRSNDQICDKCHHKSWMKKLWICPNCGYDNIRKMEEQIHG